MTDITAEQRRLCARALAALAWADGQLADHEMERIVDLVSQLEYVDPSHVPEILFTPTSMTFFADVEALPRGARIRLLHDSYLVACQEDSIGEPELAFLRRLAATIVEPARWQEVFDCLKAYADYEARCRPLWGVTHLG